MKWRLKYKADIKALHSKHLQGYSLPELSKESGIPRTTLNRYFNDAGLPVYFNRHQIRLANRKKAEGYKVYVCPTAWKRALLRAYPHKCQICGYDKIVEAHHVNPRAFGGRNTVENGTLLCPNHHAEAHAGLIDLVALLKRSELLEHPEAGNQQPSRACSRKARGAEGSETRPEAKAASPRALRTVGMQDYLRSNRDDIVRAAAITK